MKRGGGKYYKEPSYVNLTKAAIDYSDGVVLASADVDSKLVDHANEKQIPLLDYKEDFVDAYEEFYKQICPEED